MFEEIAEEYLAPTISPALAGELRRSEDLVHFDLIHDQSLKLFTKNAPSWETGFKTVGLTYDSRYHGMSFSLSDHAVQAAAAGAGVAMVRVVLAGPELLSGQLTIPFGRALPTGLMHYLFSQRPKPQRKEQADVEDWLINSISRTFQELTDKVAQLIREKAQDRIRLGRAFN